MGELFPLRARSKLIVHKIIPQLVVRFPLIIYLKYKCIINLRCCRFDDSYMQHWVLDWDDNRKPDQSNPCQLLSPDLWYHIHLLWHQPTLVCLHPVTPSRNESKLLLGGGEGREEREEEERRRRGEEKGGDGKGGEEG